MFFHLNIVFCSVIQSIREPQAAQQNKTHFQFAYVERESTIICKWSVGLHFVDSVRTPVYVCVSLSLSGCMYVCFGLHLINASQRMASLPGVVLLLSSRSSNYRKVAFDFRLASSVNHTVLSTQAGALIAYSLDVHSEQVQVQNHCSQLKHCILSIAICLLCSVETASIS